MAAHADTRVSVQNQDQCETRFIVRTGIISAVAAVTIASFVASAPAQQQEQPPAQQQQQQQQQGQPADVETRHLAPFTGSDTIAVGHVDLSKVDLKSAEQWVLGVVRAAQMPAGEQRAIASRISGGVGVAQPWIAELKKAGADRMYVVVNQITNPQPGQAGQAGASQQSSSLAVIVPVDPADDAQAIAKMLQPSDDQQVPVYEKARTEVMHDAVVLANEQALKRLRDGIAGEAAPLIDALRSVGGASTQIAYRPTGRLEQVLHMFSSAMPEAVREPVGQLQIEQNVEWAALGLDLPRTQAAKLVIDAKSAEAAQRLLAQVNGILDALQQQKQAAGAGSEPQLASNVQLLKPTVEGDRLHVTLSNEQVERLMQQGLAAAFSSTATTQPGQAGAPAARTPTPR